MKNFFLKIFFLLSFIFLNEIFSQQNDSTEINFFSSQNILKFADHLFCEEDYLRALKEYERFLTLQKNDTVKFKIALSFLKMNRFDEAETHFKNLFENSIYSEESKFEFMKSKFINNNFNEFRNFYNEIQFDKYRINSKKLFLISFLKERNSNLPEENSFINSFDENEKSEIKNFYERKKNPNYKSKTKALLLSTILPGAGKIYTKNYGDGITAFLLNGILAYVSYDNFKANHKFRGWFWGSMTAIFYAGNIDGSAASVNIYNAKIDFSFLNDVENFLKQKKYFSPDYDFCK